MMIITISLAGAAYMFISIIFSQQTQGMQLVDAYCFKDPTTGISTANILVRNIGTSPIDSSSIIVMQSDSTTSVTWSKENILSEALVTMIDECEGTEGRTCVYRISPPVGKSIVAAVSCQ